MGLVIKLHDIVSPNQFKVYYKQATSPYPINSGYSLYGTFAAGLSTVNVSGVTLNFNSNYWFKIEDQVTGRYIIENVETNDPIAYMDCCPQPVGLGAICYHSCYPPTINSLFCAGLAPTATPTPTPTATPTATPTPTPTATGAPTLTPTPTPTGEPTLTPTPTPTSIPVDPDDPTVYYYYSLGDCSDMRYSYTATTITGFSSPIVIPGCATDTQIYNLTMSDPAHTSISVDYNDPCGFGVGYSGSAIGRSTTQLTEGTVYNIGGNCWAVVAIGTPGSYTYNLDGLTSSGDCYACLGSSFTGFTYYQYTAARCDNGEGTFLYSIFPYNPTPGIIDFNYYNDQVYYLANHNASGTITEQFCATVTGYLGEYTGLQWTAPGGYNFPVGPLVCGGPYDNCSASDCITGRTDCFDGSGMVVPTPTPTPTPTGGGSYGWDCDGLGNCTYVLNGYYPTQQDCINACQSGGGGGGGY